MEKLLASFEHFKHLPQQDIHRLAESCSTRRVAKNKVLFREGDQGTEAYIVKEGIIRVHKQVSAEQIVTLAVLKEGMIFGEMAVFEGVPRYADAVAISDTELIVLSKENFNVLKDTYPDTALNIVNVFMKFLGLYLRRTTDRVYGIYPMDELRDEN